MTKQLQIPGVGGSLTLGERATPEYRAWRMARARCINPKAHAFADYGGRGISICDRWRDDYLAFLTDMGRRPSPKHEIDRKENDGHYSPDNCRWIERWENDRNRRNNLWVTYKGERRLLIELCEERGLWTDAVQWRLRKGWGLELALNTPARIYKSKRGIPPIRKSHAAEIAASGKRKVSA